jgi:hypothetical protein
MRAIASAAKIEIPFMTASLAPSRYASKSFNRVALAVNARGGSKGANPQIQKGPMEMVRASTFLFRIYRYWENPRMRPPTEAR